MEINFSRNKVKETHGLGSITTTVYKIGVRKILLNS